MPRRSSDYQGGSLTFDLQGLDLTLAPRFRRRGVVNRARVEAAPRRGFPHLVQGGNLRCGRSSSARLLVPVWRPSKEPGRAPRLEPSPRPGGEITGTKPPRGVGQVWSIRVMDESPFEQVRRVVDALYRSESRRVFATLIRLLGDFDLAEEGLHEAFAAALEQWSPDGVPANPRASLVSTGRFTATDAIRRRVRFDSSLAELAGRLDQGTAALGGEDE